MDMGIDHEFASAIRTLRNLRGWSTKEAAKQLADNGLKLDPSAITRIETGGRSIKLSEADALARTYGMTLVALLVAASKLAEAESIRDDQVKAVYGVE